MRKQARALIQKNGTEVDVYDAKQRCFSCYIFAWWFAHMLPYIRDYIFYITHYRLCTICYASHSVRVYIHITKHKYVHNIYRERER